jgi:hypothetical protein
MKTYTVIRNLPCGGFMRYHVKAICELHAAAIVNTFHGKP